MKKKLKLVFLLSLILNLLLAGMIFGLLPQRIYGARQGPEGLRARIEKLPEPARTRLRENIEQFRASPLLAQVRRTREESLALIATDPFDPAAYDRKVMQLNELRVEMGNRMATQIRDLVKDLPAEQRQAVAEALKRPPRSD